MSIFYFLFLVCNIQILWLHNDKPVRESKDFELLVEGDRCSLVIREVYLEDSGEYKCTARNIHGIATTNSRLMVERTCFF